MFHTAKFVNMTGVVYLGYFWKAGGIPKHVVIIIVVGVGAHSYMCRDTLVQILGVVRYVLVHISVADDAYMQVRVQSQLFRVLGGYILLR